MLRWFAVFRHVCIRGVVLACSGNPSRTVIGSLVFILYFALRIGMPLDSLELGKLKQGSSVGSILREIFFDSVDNVYSICPHCFRGCFTF